MKQETIPIVKRIVAVFLTLFVVTESNAQIYYNNFVRSERQWECDINFGPTNFLGDVGGGKGKGTFFLKDLNSQTTHIFYGASVAYYPNQWLGIRVSANHGMVSGFDSLIRNQGSVELNRKNRNLAFRSPITELNLAFEIYPTAYLVRNESFFNNKLRPFFSVGFGVFRFNPQGIYINPDGTRTWVDLKPLRLEGQGMSEYPDRKEYKLTAYQIPFSAGLKYFFNDKWYVGAEVLQRYTFTDYVDDVSTTYIDPNLFAKYLPKSQVAVAQQLMFRRNMITSNRSVTDFIGKERGDASNKDYYLSVFLKLGFKFGAQDNDFSCSGKRYYRRNYF